MLHKLRAGWQQPGWLNYATLPLTFLYCWLHALRGGCYRWGLCPSVGLDIPVIVVGGLSVGGVGKTPLIIALAQHFHKVGYRPGIICRGYRGTSKSWPVAVASDTDVNLVGDEARLMFELSGLPVVAGPDRVQAGWLLQARFGCDLVLSDDGFGHLRLRRDADVVVVDGEAGLGNNWCLPAGPLREKPAALARATAVVINAIDPNRVSHRLRNLHPMTFTMTMALGIPYNLHSAEPRELERFSGGRVYAVAGVGNPERFFAQLTAAGIDIAKRPFADHHRFRESDFATMTDAPVLLTEKDAIKCRGFTNATNLWAVPGTVTPAPALLRLLTERLTERLRETDHARN